MDLGLRDAVVLVTGGCRGIGAAIVARFLEEGARVVVADRDEAAGAKLAADARTNGHSVYRLERDRQRQKVFLRVAAGLEDPAAVEGLR